MLAREWLRFVEYMRESDGRFATALVNIQGTKIHAGAEDGTLGAEYAIWALATAWRVTGDRRYLQYASSAARTSTGAMNVLALRALALMELYRKRPTNALGRDLCALCERICASGAAYFRDQEGQQAVELSGYYQLLAVARAGRLFSRLDFLRACESAVTSLVEPVIGEGFFHVYPQIPDPLCASDIAPLTLGLEELWQSIHRAEYRNLAIHCVDWLYGNNSAGAVMYERTLGRCADAVQEGEQSPYCGAEAAVAAGFIELAHCRLHD
jgi:hypothetical protein